MGPPLEDAAREIAQHGAGAELDECTHTERVGALDLIGKMNRECKLLRQSLADRVRVLRIGLCVGVADNVDHGAANLDLRKRIAKRPRNGRHRGTVKRRRDGQALGGDALARAQLLQALHCLDAAGYDDLVCGVQVGDDSIAAGARDQRCGLPGAGDQRQHPARVRVRRIAHQLAARTREREQFRDAETTGRAQRGELAEAVADVAARLEAERADELERRQARESERRLRPFGRAQARLERLLRGVIEHRWREGELMHRAAAEAHVGDAVPHPPHARMGHGQIRAHADVLAALSGKQQRGFAADRR